MVATPIGTLTRFLDLGRFPATLSLATIACAFAPAYVVRWHVAFYPTTLLESAILLTLVAFAIESWRLRLAPRIRWSVAIPAGVFIIAGAISVVVAPDRRAALGIYRAYLLEPVAFFVVVASVVDSSRRAALLLAGLGIGGTVVALANWFVILNAIRHHTLNVSLTPPVVIYTNANAIALFLVPLIAVAGALLLHGTDRTERQLSAVFLVIAAVAVLLSFSRGGYLALAVVGVGLALSHRRRWLLLAAAIVVALSLVLIPPINHRIAVELDFTNPNNTLVGRFGLWAATWQMLKQHFLFGAGLSGFALTIAPYWNPYHADRFIYPHNIVLTFWSETGLLGLAAMGWILVATMRLAWVGWRRGPRAWRPFELGVLIALVGVLTHGLVDVPYFKNDLSLEFWTLIGLASAGTFTKDVGTPS